MARPKKAVSASKDRTVHPGVYERAIGTENPYFQVRIRHRGEKHLTERFPYVPPGAVDKDGSRRRGMKREAALNDAIACASKEKAQFHFYGKPRDQVADEYTLRQWIIGWQAEACDLVDPATGLPLLDLPVRKGAAEDRKQVGRLITIADDYAQRHKRASLMDRRVVELEKSDFNGPHGLLKMLTGRKAPGATLKPAASTGTKRRALAMLGAVWTHARDRWNMDIPRPWKDVVIHAQERGPAVGRALDVEEYQAVNDALASVHPHTLAAIHFLRWTAARAGEMQKLRWEHITWPSPSNSLAGPVAKFVGTKTPRQGTYRERDLPLSAGAIAALAMVYDTAQGPPKEGVVFPSPSDPKRPISRHTAYQAFVRAVRRAGVPHARLHDLRHTRTTEMSADVSKAQAMVLTGHSDERTFMRYTHLAEGTASKIAEGDIKRALRAKGETENEPVKASAVLDLLKGLELTPAERMEAISLLAGK